MKDQVGTFLKYQRRGCNYNRTNRGGNAGENRMIFSVFAARSKGTGSSRSNLILQVRRQCWGLYSHCLSDAYSMCWTFLSLYGSANFAQCAYSGEMNIYAVSWTNTQLEVSFHKSYQAERKVEPMVQWDLLNVHPRAVPMWGQQESHSVSIRWLKSSCIKSSPSIIFIGPQFTLTK